jgi:hypothetical protein
VAEGENTAFVAFGVGTAVAVGKVLGRTVKVVELVVIHALNEHMVS